MQKPSNDPKSHRPISILPCLGKFLEKSIYKKAGVVLGKERVDSGCADRLQKTSQHTRYHSQIGKFYTKTGFEDEKISVAVLYDFEGSYNNVCHKKMTSKMLRFGFPQSKPFCWKLFRRANFLGKSSEGTFIPSINKTWPSTGSNFKHSSFLYIYIWPWNLHNRWY